MTSINEKYRFLRRAHLITKLFDYNQPNRNAYQRTNELTTREMEQGFESSINLQESDKNLINTLENLGYLPHNFQGS